MRIHLPSSDEKEAIKLKGKYISQLSSVISSEEDIMKTIGAFAQKLQKSVKEKRELINIIENLIKAEQIASRNPQSNIDQDEIRMFSQSKDLLNETNANQLELADALFELGNAMKTFLKKKKEYMKEYKDLVKLNQDWQNMCEKLMQQRNKFVEDSKLQKLEQKIKDLESEINRHQSLSDRKFEVLLYESKTLDGAWTQLKNSIKKYGW
ncbi:MAG: hypothetical protein ACTSRZ_17705 [Promethearchaeota archaeon]